MMPDAKISNLPASPTLTDSAIIIAVQGGVAESTTLQQIRSGATGNLVAFPGDPVQQTTVGAVGPGGAPGNATPNTVLYRDVPRYGVTLSGPGPGFAQVWTLGSPGAAAGNISFGAGTTWGAWTTGTNNFGVGVNVFEALTTGSDNIAIGVDTFKASSTTSRAIAIGYSALGTGAAADETIAIGRNTARKGVTGARNTLVGESFVETTASTDNTAVGYQALRIQGGAYTGTANTAIGHQAINNPTTASNNVAIGNSAFTAATTGSRNVAIGPSALGGAGSAAVNDVVALGHGAMSGGGSGSQNIAIGTTVMNSASFTGSRNVGIGQQTLQVATTGNDNTVIGASAMPTVTTYDRGTHVGGSTNAGTTLTAALATSLGYNIQVGTDAAAIGTNTASNGTGSVAIGTDSGGTGANSTVTNMFLIGTASHTSTVLGRAQRVAGTGTSLAKVGGSLGQNFTTLGNTAGGGAENTIASYPITANTWAADGQRIVIRYGGTYSATAGNKQLRVTVGGNEIFNSSALATNAGAWFIETVIVRTSATTLRCFTRYLSNAPTAAANTVRQQYTQVTVVDITANTINANLLALSSGGGSAANDVVHTMSYTRWLPEA